MKVYQHDTKPGELHLPLYSGQDISASHLPTLGVQCHSLTPKGSSAAIFLDELAKSKRFEFRDEITYSPAAKGAAYEDANALNNQEHIHDDDKIRYITRGGSYFDVREADDRKWVRIKVLQGDLLVLPKGIYHRFAVDENNDVTMARLFKDADHIVQAERSVETEAFGSRQTYVRALEIGSFPEK